MQTPQFRPWSVLLPGILTFALTLTIAALVSWRGPQVQSTSGIQPAIASLTLSEGVLLRSYSGAERGPGLVDIVLTPGLKTLASPASSFSGVRLTVQNLGEKPFHVEDLAPGGYFDLEPGESMGYLGGSSSGDLLYWGSAGDRVRFMWKSQ